MESHQKIFEIPKTVRNQFRQTGRDMEYGLRHPTPTKTNKKEKRTEEFNERSEEYFSLFMYRQITIP